ncbi:MAG: agmatinase [Candidatus Methanofastidiosia archaeon]
MSEDLAFYTFKKNCIPLKSPSIDKASYILLGIPFDGTQTGHTGARYGPTSIRNATFELELFDIETAVDLSTITVYDIGDVDCVPGSPSKTFERIASTASQIPHDPIWIGLGGEHSITFPLVKELQPDFVISFDAHPDLRDDYMGLSLSHSCVMRRIHEEGIDCAVIGVRESSKNEYEYANKHKIQLVHPSELSSFSPPKNKKLYITIDLDVLESYINVGNPVPGGISFNDMTIFLKKIIDSNTVVGFDIVELCSRSPDASALVAAKLLYKLIAYTSKSNKIPENK